MTFADSNVFIYAVGKPHPLKVCALPSSGEALGAARDAVAGVVGDVN